MGIILCNIHGKSGIVQMSNQLYEQYTNRTTEEIIKIIFQVDDLGDFVYFISNKEDFNNYSNIKTLNDFEEVFLSISDNSGACLNCFKNYIQHMNIKIANKTIKVTNNKTDSKDL